MVLVNKHIVAIDDTDSILTLLRISLETEGAIFSGAATASGGLALCEAKHPDLVILDIGLPDYKGFDILPRLKKRNEMPVIVLSVCNEPDSVMRAEALGADAYVTKPFNVEALITLIHEKLCLARSTGFYK